MKPIWPPGNWIDPGLFSPPPTIFFCFLGIYIFRLPTFISIFENFWASFDIFSLLTSFSTRSFWAFSGILIFFQPSSSYHSISIFWLLSIFFWSFRPFFILQHSTHFIILGHFWDTSPQTYWIFYFFWHIFGVLFFWLFSYFLISSRFINLNFFDIFFFSFFVLCLPFF